MSKSLVKLLVLSHLNVIDQLLSVSTGPLPEFYSNNDFAEIGQVL